MNATCYDPQYEEGESTFGARRSMQREKIVDDRSWYRRWYFGLCRDGALWLGLGPIEVAARLV